jgi:LPXTG-motif cell wall-anchored protein
VYKKRTLIAVLALGAAVWASGQVYSNAPTNNDYRLTFLSPNDGATITGTDLTIVLSRPSIPTGRAVNEKKLMDIMTPTFQIWVDGKDYGNLPNGENVFTAHDLSYGPHKIAAAAKNTAGELVDRKEIHVTTISSGTVTSRQTYQVQPAAAPPSAPAPAPDPALAAIPSREPLPARAPLPSAPPPSLPKTATSYPAAAVAGLGLLIAGFALGRPRRS